jgi:hypothetical protein
MPTPNCIQSNHLGEIKLFDGACCGCGDVIFKVDWTVSGTITPFWELQDTYPFPNQDPPDPADRCRYPFSFCQDNITHKGKYICCGDGWTVDFSARTKHELKLFPLGFTGGFCGNIPQDALTCVNGDIVGLPMDPSDIIESFARINCGERLDDPTNNCDTENCPDCPGSSDFDFMFLFDGFRTNLGFRLLRGSDGNFYFEPFGSGRLESNFLAECFCSGPRSGFSEFGWGCTAGIPDSFVINYRDHPDWLPEPPIEAANLGPGPLEGNYNISFDYTLEKQVDPGFGIFDGHSGSITYDLNFS